MRKEEARCWLIWSNEHQLWWRANSLGYTSDMREAGLYTLDQAQRTCSFSIEPDKVADDIAVFDPRQLPPRVILIAPPARRA